MTVSNTVTQDDFRIEDVQRATLNGKAVKTFRAYRKDGDRFVFVGAFSAPARTPNDKLWQKVA